MKKAVADFDRYEAEDAACEALAHDDVYEQIRRETEDNFNYRNAEIHAEFNPGY